MLIEHTIESTAVLAVITGEIDGKTAPQAQAELLPLLGHANKLLLDMRGVTFLSSAGLRMLLLLYRQATAHDGKVALVGLSPEIMDTMAMTGFLDFFIIADTTEAGRAALT